MLISLGVSALLLESFPTRRVWPQGRDHTGIDKHFSALPSLSHMLPKIKATSLNKGREGAYIQLAGNTGDLEVGSLLCWGVSFYINTAINSKCCS